MSNRTARTAEVPDTGCEFAASCFDCPLVRCKHDDPEGARRARLVLTSTSIAGLTTDEAAERLSISRRTVFRIREEARRATR